MIRPRKSSPPAWWNLELYNFLKKMPLEGWIWEFMRRARLLKILDEPQPVEAMNPNKNRETVPWFISLYYRLWDDKFWPSGKPMTVPCSISWKGFTRVFHRTFFDLELYDLENGSERDPLPPSQWQTIEIDLRRRDSVIMRELQGALKRARKEFPQPRRVNPRMSEWYNNRVLPIWDLRDLGIIWKRIPRFLRMNDPEIETEEMDVDEARKAFGVANDFIEKEKWKFLALYTSDE